MQVVAFGVFSLVITLPVTSLFFLSCSAQYTPQDPGNKDKLCFFFCFCTLRFVCVAPICIGTLFSHFPIVFSPLFFLLPRADMNRCASLHLQCFPPPFLRQVLRTRWSFDSLSFCLSLHVKSFFFRLLRKNNSCNSLTDAHLHTNTHANDNTLLMDIFLPLHICFSFSFPFSNVPPTFVIVSARGEDNAPKTPPKKRHVPLKHRIFFFSFL